MNPMISEQKVLVRTQSGKTAHGAVRVQSWSKSERTRRALKFWALAWVGALFCVLLPIVHFVLVPSLLLAGPTGAYIISQQTSIVLGGEALCPQCNQTLPLVRGPDKWPLTDLCSKCQTTVWLEKITS
jgi:hypothetical protein